ncbi:hypothetical protein BD779DRAFT_1476484 [Infundibulicybe gibba]|nr:hypothetical protein BD779DRAFT_1476484 [Infundibulicybe gibba]
MLEESRKALDEYAERSVRGRRRRREGILRHMRKVAQEEAWNAREEERMRKKGRRAEQWAQIQGKLAQIPTREATGREKNMTAQPSQDWTTQNSPRDEGAATRNTGGEERVRAGEPRVERAQEESRAEKRAREEGCVRGTEGWAEERRAGKRAKAGSSQDWMVPTRGSILDERARILETIQNWGC